MNCAGTAGGGAASVRAARILLKPLWLHQDRLDSKMWQRTKTRIPNAYILHLHQRVKMGLVLEYQKKKLYKEDFFQDGYDVWEWAREVSSTSRWERGISRGA